MMHDRSDGAGLSAPAEGSASDAPAPEVLGAVVRGRRETLGLLQAELADLAGCSARFVHTLENGKPSLRLDKVLDVLEVLGVDLVAVRGRGRIRSPELLADDP